VLLRLVLRAFPPFVLCLLRVPVPYSAVCFPRVAFAVPAAPVVHFHSVSFPSIAPHCAPLCVLPIEPVCSPAFRIVVFRFSTTYVSVESPGALVRPVVRIARLPLSRDANHWSRALATSSWVAQDTHTLTYHIHTHPVANY